MYNLKLLTFSIPGIEIINFPILLINVVSKIRFKSFKNLIWGIKGKNL